MRKRENYRELLLENYCVFIPLYPNTSIKIILKKPRIDSSIHKVWLPKAPAYILRK